MQRKTGGAGRRDVCSVCRKRNGPASPCSVCHRAFHLACLGPDDAKPVGDRPWVCPQKHLGLALPSPAPGGWGVGVSLGTVMRHLELASSDQTQFHALVRALVDYSRGQAALIGPREAMVMYEMVAQHVGDDVLVSLQHGGPLVGAFYPWPASLSPACTKCQAPLCLLRTACLECGAIGQPLYRLPPAGKKRGEAVSKESRLASAKRGIKYYESVQAEARNTGDHTFLAHKMFIALRGTELEAQALEMCERVVRRFLDKAARVASFKDLGMNALKDYAEGFHVVGRMPSLLTEGQELLAKFLEEFEIGTTACRLSEVAGFVPAPPHMPYGSAQDCSYCSADNDNGASVCSDCKKALISRPKYEFMSDACVWLYVFGSLGLRGACETSGGRVEPLAVADILRILPEAREYLSFEELGPNYWTHQGYFLTHLVYVFSDYGEHRLKRALYVEEFTYLAANLRRVIDRGDCELLGEYIHCLGILGYPGEEGDDLLADLVEEGVRFLVRAEEETFGEKGSWGGAEPYNKYHSAWCGVVGLVSGNRTEQVNCPGGLLGNPLRFM